MNATKPMRWSYADSNGEWRMVLRPDGVRLTWMVGRDYIVETIRHAPPAGPLEFRNAMPVAEFAAEYDAAEDMA